MQTPLSCTILLAFVVFLPVLDQKLCNFIALVMKFGQLPLLEKRENFLFGSFKVASPLLGLFSFFSKLFCSTKTAEARRGAAFIEVPGEESRMQVGFSHRLSI